MTKVMTGRKGVSMAWKLWIGYLPLYRHDAYCESRLLFKSEYQKKIIFLFLNQNICYGY